MRPRTLAATATTALLALSLLGCAPTTSTDTGSDSDSSPDSTESGSGTFVTLSGTGDYSVPADMPIGGYQIVGEPASQPDGCTWTIFDANGEVLATDQGVYVFITDVSARFTTDGCGEWEQFE
ncbi:MAG: hypothetical protein IT189_09450 [Microbacteriaceae bacterium]|nr:hypothetical protein [Microbacteriaceae bacterium]